jgi:hypothetical protein
MVPTGIVHQTQLSTEVAKAIRKLGKEVVRVNYSLGTDSNWRACYIFPDRAHGRSQQRGQALERDNSRRNDAFR